MSKFNKSRPRLGRGLSSLLSVGARESEADENVPRGTLSSSDEVEQTPAPVLSGQLIIDVSVDAIRPNPHQPRREFNEHSLTELAASLKSTGLIQPIIVRHTPEGYELIAGERRLRAAKLAGIATLPAIIKDVDRLTQAQMALVENIQREDLNPVDRAFAYRTLITELGLTQADLALRMGEDRSSISHHLRLLDLSPAVLELVRDGKLSAGQGKLLAGVTDILEQARLSQLAVSQDLSVRNLERLIQAGGTSAPATKETEGGGSKVHLKDLEKTMSRSLGMRVQVRSGKKGKGRLILHFGSLDQFDDLMTRLGVVAE